MGFVKSPEEMDRYFSLAVRVFSGARMLGLLYETEPEIVARLLPPPLEPASEPWALCYIADFPDTNLGPGYQEGAIFVRCQYNGEVGNYCLSMPLNDEARMHNGRNIYGFPKKLGQVSLHREGNVAEGWIERHGIRFVTIRAELTMKLDEPPLKVGPNFLFKYMPAANLSCGFDGPVLLVRQRNEFEYHSFEMGAGEIVFAESPHDPWSEIVCKQVIASYYFTSTNRLLPGDVLTEADPNTFLPYSFSRTDWEFGDG